MYTLCDKLVVLRTLHAAMPLSLLQERQLYAEQLSDFVESFFARFTLCCML